MSEDPSLESEEQSENSEQSGNESSGSENSEQSSSEEQSGSEETTEEPTCVWTSLLITDLEDSIAELKSLLEGLQTDVSAIKSTVNSLKTTLGTSVNNGQALGVKDTDGNTSVSLTVTRDSNNQIISIK